MVEYNLIDGQTGLPEVNYASDLMSHEPGDCMQGADKLDSYEQDHIHIGKHMGRLTEPTGKADL